ncbi:hypothetical protein O181_075422 [Austropuccinia psidii MF-1]|uniref:Reverse transcriptase Ty1/copia-type domain-containing protein n=1 Tax=Austropuccinia psidii MF-1 TaxID=1389203 RepID=A0A9Q3ICW0_9BASI|nr:hypothetical protein [Austropuccinia psidii MF-1]
MWIHIDNGVVTSNSPATIESFRKTLCSNFEIKWSHTLQQIVGLEYAFGKGEVTIMQTRLTRKILKAHPRKVIQQDFPLQPLPSITLAVQGPIVEATPFRSAIGLLAYLFSRSFPDLDFSFNYLARHSMRLLAAHWELLYPVVAYLLKSHRHGIMLNPGFFSLDLWSDAGWGAKLEQSQSGFMQSSGIVPFFGG